jgi:hypothetical protein
VPVDAVRDREIVAKDRQGMWCISASEVSERLGGLEEVVESSSMRK